MPYAQTSTALGALSAAGSGSYVPVPRGATPQKAGPVVLLINSAVTSGFVVAIEGVNVTAGGTTAVKELYRATVAANGSLAVPIKDLTENGSDVDQLRLTMVSRTDGTCTATIITPT